VLPLLGEGTINRTESIASGEGERLIPLSL